MRDDTPTSVPLAIIPLYGLFRLTNQPLDAFELTEHEVSLRRDVYGLETEELLAVLSSSQVQVLVQKWRLNLADASIWIAIDELLRHRTYVRYEVIASRQARLKQWEAQREAVRRCAAAMVEQIDGRALRGMARQLKFAGEGAMPSTVQIYKWGHELAVKAHCNSLHNFDRNWDFELAALTFGEELELELHYLDSTLSGPQGELQPLHEHDEVGAQAEEAGIEAE